jgi:flagellar biosynthesis protein FlhG|tara:strand:- start:4015 stop:4806 length:792 start_codon:yes stop_codon:yes gene_type:complete
MVHSLAFVSGKGGVGKTSLAVNSAIRMAQNGLKVAILDADFGLSNANIMMNVKADKTISDVLAGTSEMEEVIYDPYPGVKLIPGGSGTLNSLNLDTEERWKIIRSLDFLEADLDYLIVDAPAGASNSSIEFASAVGQVVITLVGEPTSFMDAYAFLKALHQEKGVNKFSVIVNMAQNEVSAVKDFESFKGIVKRFLAVEIEMIGWMPGSPEVVKSIIARKPFALGEQRQKQLSRCLDNIVKSIQASEPEIRSGIHFFSSSQGS